MSVLAVGGEADCFEPVSGQDYLYETTSGRYESTVTRGSMRVVQGSSEIELITAQALTDAYIHFWLYQEAVAGAVNDWIQIKKANGDPAFRIALKSDGNWAVQKYKTAAWSSDLAATVSAPVVNDSAAFDVHIVVGASGSITIYKEGVSILSYSGDTTIDNSTFGRIHFKGQTGGANEMNIGQVILADESTVGWKLATLTPNGAGTNTGWTGDYSDIDEFAYDNTDFIEALAANLVETSTMSDLSGTLGSFNVKAVVVAMRAENDSGSAVTDVQAALRVSGTNYFSSNIGLTKDGAQHSVQTVFANNPATSGSWSQAAVNALEAGVKSV